MNLTCEKKGGFALFYGEKEDLLNLGLQLAVAAFGEVQQADESGTGVAFYPAGEPSSSQITVSFIPGALLHARVDLSIKDIDTAFGMAGVGELVANAPDNTPKPPAAPDVAQAVADEVPATVTPIEEAPVPEPVVEETPEDAE